MINIKRKIKKMIGSKSIGRQIVRLDLGYQYFYKIIAMVSSSSMFYLALDAGDVKIPVLVYFMTVLPIVFLFLWAILFLMEKTGVIQSDRTHRQSINLEANALLYDKVIIPKQLEMIEKVSEKIIKELKELKGN